MIKIKYFLILILLASCKSSQEPKTTISKIENQEFNNTILVTLDSELDLIFRSIMKHEYQELSSKFSVVDQTMGETSVKIEGFEFISKKNIKWNKNSFLKINYIDGEKVLDFKKNNINSYQNLLDRYGKNGWFELYIPKFSKDRKQVLIELNFRRGNSFNVFDYYILEKKKKYYKVIQFKRIK